ncbi:MAG TPA: transglutaminase family protein [Oceanipulchritudo sp.]|nr:transglutaminase family protein [Oceanipulchritudo sp.]
MRFRISHETAYRYATPASESVGELRIYPGDTSVQEVSNFNIHLDPEVPVDTFVDYFGNTVGCFAIPWRHNKLRVRMTAEVGTCPPPDPGPAAEIPVGEARRLSRGRRIELYLYRQPTTTVPLGKVSDLLRKRFFRDSIPLREAVENLNSWIHTSFTYMPGVTEVSTPLSKVLKERRGVCQDFAHLMLSFLRHNGLPARYVSGYIEPVDPDKAGGDKLVGAVASHAWVEVNLPDGSWWGLDPTNNQSAGERHVKVAVGRDYHDVAPLRGTFKGATDQKLQVIVSMERKGASRRAP